MFLGRKDFQIKHLGYRIELGEIEHAAQQVDGIHNCCVVYDQNKKGITMFFESERDLSPSFIRERLSVRLPKYMLPTVFRRLDRIPLNSSGKIDRRSSPKGNCKKTKFETRADHYYRPPAGWGAVASKSVLSTLCPSSA